jgi:hypothetical protein
MALAAFAALRSGKQRHGYTPQFSTGEIALTVGMRFTAEWVPIQQARKR